MCREDINSGAQDVHELHARDRLRRNVQWMAGIAPLAPPTLSEMAKQNDKLLAKVDKLLEKASRLLEGAALPPLRCRAPSVGASMPGPPPRA